LFSRCSVCLLCEVCRRLTRQVLASVRRLVVKHASLQQRSHMNAQEVTPQLFNLLAPLDSPWLQEYAASSQPDRPPLNQVSQVASLCATALLSAHCFYVSPDRCPYAPCGDRRVVYTQCGPLLRQPAGSAHRAEHSRPPRRTTRTPCSFCARPPSQTSQSSWTKSSLIRRCSAACCSRPPAPLAAASSSPSATWRAPCEPVRLRR